MGPLRLLGRDHCHRNDQQCVLLHFPLSPGTTCGGHRGREKRGARGLVPHHPPLGKSQIDYSSYSGLIPSTTFRHCDDPHPSGNHRCLLLLGLEHHPQHSVLRDNVAEHWVGNLMFFASTIALHLLLIRILSLQLPRPLSNLGLRGAPSDHAGRL